MLIDETIKITWNNSTKKWYESKGYKYTKIRDVFVVKVEDIIETSTFKVNVKCDFCGKIHSKEYRNFISGRNVVEKDCCSSKKCLATKTKEINLKLYGVESCMQRENIKDKVSSKLRTSFDEVLFLCKEKNLTSIFKDEDYKGNYSNLIFICNKHKESGIQSVRYASLQQGQCGCKVCSMDNRKKKLRLNEGLVFEEFYKKGLKVLDGEEYENKDKSIKYVCMKHPGIIQHACYNSLKKTSIPCDICRNEDSISSLNRRLRSSISKWRKSTEVFYNNKCAFTGSLEYDVHHIHPFNEIIKESLQNLNINKNTTDGYEIKMLKNEVLRLHDVYGLGVNIHPRIHIVFHAKYGKDATCEDFEHFKSDFNNGKYKDIVDELTS